MDFKGGLLLDESVSLGDISTSSFGTPLLAKGGTDPDDSPITQPHFNTRGDESEDGQDVTPSSPLDDKVPTRLTETNEDVTPPSPPKRDRTPSPKANPEPQTPTHRPRIQITMETEGIVVSAQCPFAMMHWLTVRVKSKIWSTIGDIIQPGYQYPGEGRTLRAKETLYSPPWPDLRVGY